MAQRVLVFGGTGFLGRAVVDALLAAGAKPVLVVRPSSAAKVETLFPKNQIEIIKSELNDLAKITERVKFLQISAVVYAVGLIREFPSQGITFVDAHFNFANNALELAKSCNIAKFVYISANGVDHNTTGYERTKLSFEQLLAQQMPQASIIRPGLIFAKDSAYSFMDVLKQLTLLPLVPVVGLGNFAMQPVSRSGVAQVIATAALDLKLLPQIITVCGTEQLTFREMVLLVAKKRHRVFLLIPVPTFLLKILGRVFRHIPQFPVTDEQIIMLMHGNASSNAADVWENLGIPPQKFSDFLQSEF